MPTTTNQSSIEARILRAIPACQKDVGHAVPKAEWFDVMDHVAPPSEYELCEDQFLEVLAAMAKVGSIVFDEDLMQVWLPPSE